ncbi:MAG: lyase family protein, partial [Caulobacteraceae bacterium]
MTGDSDDAQRNSPGHSMWGGRFYAKPAALMRRINASIGFDRRLAAEDIAGSRAHAAMLADQGIISKQDAQAIDRGLQEVGEEIAAGRFTFKEELEDIHMNIEARLSDLIGEAAGRLHTARSRNDQVALDLRLWVRAACERARGAIAELQ